MRKPVNGRVRVTRLNQRNGRERVNRRTNELGLDSVNVCETVPVCLPPRMNIRDQPRDCRSDGQTENESDERFHGVIEWPNGKTERRGRCSASALARDVTRPRSLQ